MRLGAFDDVRKNPATRASGAMIPLFVEILSVPGFAHASPFRLDSPSIRTMESSDANVDPHLAHIPPATGGNINSGILLRSARFRRRK